MTDDHAFPDGERAAERYLLGEMSETEREQYEEHFFNCADCAADVRSTATFLDALRACLPPAPGTGPLKLKTMTIVEPWWSIPARTLRALCSPLPPAAALA